MLDPPSLFHSRSRLGHLKKRNKASCKHTTWQFRRGSWRTNPTKMILPGFSLSALQSTCLSGCHSPVSFSRHNLLDHQSDTKNQKTIVRTRMLGNLIASPAAYHIRVGTASISSIPDQFTIGALRLRNECTCTLPRSRFSVLLIDPFDSFHLCLEKKANSKKASNYSTNKL